MASSRVTRSSSLRDQDVSVVLCVGCHDPIPLGKIFKVEWIHMSGKERGLIESFCSKKCYTKSKSRKEKLSKYFVYFAT
jgi:hypothetical protein